MDTSSRSPGSGSEATWLDDEEQSTWRAFLGASRAVFTQVERELLASSGMTIAQYGILALLSETPGGSLRMTDVADATQSLPSSLSHAAARLEECGWIVRTKCPSDRRSWLASITPAGRAALGAAAPDHARCVRRVLFDHLRREQVSELREACEAVLTGLGGELGPESGCPETACVEENPG